MNADPLFPGFTTHRVRTSETEIRCVVGGNGPPLLMLHGYPQTHAMWHRVAPVLAHDYTVVCADLRGYGDSGKPESDATHAAYSKRAMARDMVELMRDLGHPRFILVGHDRGARVSHRLCVDHPDAVSRVALLDISPTRTMYLNTDLAFATAYYHWFFLIQPFDLPERLIGADPVYYLHRKLGGWGTGLSHFDPRALAEYERCFADTATIHATCEDYRASASIDLEHDAGNEQHRVACPLLVLWGERGVVHRLCKPLDDWRAVAEDVRGRALPAGHYLAEEAPDETLRELRAFF
ncbi:MAG: alpha/beta hydrolase [Proteobacteria bacterium]|jgi:haloacetate dehalogenase|nr:alpha/beta hydrolase [Pseudomonadota bacterium]